jgi:hypothetical protein
MSYPQQGPPEPNVPRTEQPTQHASLPLYGPPGQPPPYGSQQPYAPQPYGAPQSHRAPPCGAPRPYGGAPPYGAPQPYGAASGAGPGRRPGAVSAAAVLAFVNAGLVIITKLLAFVVLATFAGNAIREWGMGLVVANYTMLLAKLVAAGLLIWGGVAAVQGRSRRILAIATATEATLAVLGVVVSLASSGRRGWFVGTFVELAFTATILTLILQPSSADFFRARRKGW